MYFSKHFFINFITVAIPIKHPNAKTITTGKYERLKCKSSFTAVTTGIYKPKIKSNVEPDIPGKIIAEIATIATKNTYIPVPKFKLCKFILCPSPEAGFKSDIVTTNAIPITVNIRFLYLPLNSSFSSKIIIGIENNINPKNSELIWYIWLSKILPKTNIDDTIPITQPIPILNKNLIASILSSFLPVIK